MTVTGLEPVGKIRVKVFLDGEEAFVLYKKEIVCFDLKEGSELSDERYREIVEGTLRKRARLQCMNLLKAMDRTEHQLYTKLKQSGYPREVAEDAVAYVKSFHYVDDVGYARRYLENRGQSRSMLQIKQELLRKGISKEDIAEALSQAETVSEEETIKNLAVRRKMNLENPTREELKKYYAFFQRKGFSYPAIRNILRSVEVLEDSDTFA